MRGRKPLPHKLKVLLGDEPEEEGGQEAKPKSATVKIPPCPKHLRGEAKKEWARVCKELRSLGLLDGVDRAALTLYCAAWHEWDAATKTVEQVGQTYETEHGWRVRPEVKIAQAAHALMHRLLAEFGLTPVARERLKVKTAAKTPEKVATRKRGGVG